MPLYEINDKRPLVGEGTWIAPDARIIGEVLIGRNCYIGFGSVIRGDFGKIIINDGALVEENVVIHTGSVTEIGEKAILGHMVMVHDAVIGAFSLIGMQSMICNAVTIGEWTIVAEQSLVLNHQTIPANKIYAGSPASEIGSLTERHKKTLITAQEAYQKKIEEYLISFKRID